MVAELAQNPYSHIENRDPFKGIASSRRCHSEPANTIKHFKILVRKRGVEPLPLAGLDPKSSASANSATFALLVFNNLQNGLLLLRPICN